MVVNTMQDCADLCCALEECLYWTFREGYSWDMNACWLKTSDSGRRAPWTSGASSGQKVCGECGGPGTTAAPVVSPTPPPSPYACTDSTPVTVLLKGPSHSIGEPGRWGGIT